MAKLHELKRLKAQKVEEKRQLLAKAVAIAEKDDLTDEDQQVSVATQADIQALTTEIAGLDSRITDLEAILAEQAAAAAEIEPGGEDGPGAEGGDEERGLLGGYNRRGFGHNGGSRGLTPHGYGEPKPKEGKGFKAARFAFGVLLAKGNGMAGAAQFIERRFGDKAVAKALNTAGVATGGALIPQDFSNEIIELLRAETVIRQLNPMIVDMPLGNLTIPRIAAGATAGYQGELDDIAASQETFDDLQLNAKKLTALVPVSNDLIRRATGNVEQIIRDDMVQSLARREDLAFLIGDGSGTSPIGLLNLCPASNKFLVPAFTATDNATILTAVVGTLLGMRLALTNNMSRMIRPAWIMTPTAEAFLMGLRDQVGNFVYRDEMRDRKTLDGIPYRYTQQLPTNINTATSGDPVNNGSYLFLADFADVVLAETYNMSVDASDVASYKDSGGNMVSTFTRDQTAFRVIEEHDFNLRHQASVAVAVLPGWAPAGFSNFGPGASYYVQAPSGDMSAAPSTWGVAAPTGSNNPANASANVPGGTQPGRP
ncbi:phage major capsid protein [Roseomonas chloroacetimidivorans]|uniref:phage major capsid protein n=1 Tax=Roseomonas chloroacetimidivorans TaxID=1766656 RepID=UPI003C728FBA